MNFLLTRLFRGVYSAAGWEKVGEHGSEDYSLPRWHTPVMPEEVVFWLRPAPDCVILDCTVGYCGHAEKILGSSAPHGIVIGIDRDAGAIRASKPLLDRFGTRLILIKGHFVDLKRHLADRGITKVNGVLFDLGVSSRQLDEPARGLSFQTDGPLDMRMDQSTGRTAAEIVNSADESDLANMIFEFGEERFSRRIARAIVRARANRPLETTRELVSIIERAVPGSYRRGRIHCATRTFQALRIAVNQELEHLEPALRAAVDILDPGGRLCVISFHSLEDRIVKQTFRSLSGRQLTILTKKPQLPTDEETGRNPRSRSAKLRVAERTQGGDHR
ncbi:MAG: 16S rRNA (cytosine(1402)-N(4))-methyltransferase RsmH [Nitrospira sp. CR1.3]|nr:16S rRNA (cytosine(1402)-N(4))-methyltransferase RsmH [Nitrospira sp. CR1.3]